jgi:hypothetical protein
MSNEKNHSDPLQVHELIMIALRSLIGFPIKKSNATNSIKLSFDFQEKEKGRAYIWLDPPWRYSLHGKIITGSGDWPRWDGVEDKNLNEPIWIAWCKLFAPLDEATLVSFEVKNDFPDLLLRFSSGHVIETFGNTSDNCWWYYRDRLTGEYCEANPDGIIHDWVEIAED